MTREQRAEILLKSWQLDREAAQRRDGLRLWPVTIYSAAGLAALPEFRLQFFPRLGEQVRFKNFHAASLLDAMEWTDENFPMPSWWLGLDL